MKGPCRNPILLLLALMIVLSMYIFQQWKLNLKQVPIMPDPETDAMVVIQTMPFLLENENGTREYPQPYHQRKLRMEEYIYSLTQTLKNSYITQVCILYSATELKNYIREQLSNLKENYKHKLKYVQTEEANRASTLLQYAYTHYQNEIVMITQADCYPGYGLDLIDKSKMLEYNVMYALTRQARVEKNCDMTKDKVSMTCDDVRYIGSHDTYIFIPQGKLPNAALTTTNFKSYYRGIDNLMIFTFRNILKFKVLNPCKVIIIFHLHCTTSMRSVVRPRVDNKTNKGLARPTAKLFI